MEAAKERGGEQSWRKEPSKAFKSRHEATIFRVCPTRYCLAVVQQFFTVFLIIPSQTAKYIPCHSMLEVSDLLFSLQLREFQLRDHLQVSKEIWMLDFKLKNGLETERLFRLVKLN